MRRLFDWILRLTSVRESYLLALLAALIVGYGASEVYHWNMEDDYRERFRDQAWFAASSLENENLHGLAMGTAMLLGLNEPELKELVLGRRTRDDPESLRRLRAVRLLLNADGVFVFDSLGDVVAHETPLGRLTGSNISYRLYWQQAMRGTPVVYPAIGTQSVERKLFIAAPIRSGTTPASELLGAVVVEVSADYLDYQIGMGGYHAILVSPQGVVFAATDKRWLFRLTHEATPEELTAIRSLRQFGPAIPGDTKPEALPFDMEPNVVKIGGVRFAKATAPVRWNDPSGDWTLVAFSDMRAADSWKQRGVIALVAALIMMALMELFRRAIHYEAARREAVGQAEAAADQLAAAARQKLQLSEITISLQQARDPAALAAVFFRKLAELLPLHQGTLYFIDSLGEDKSTLILAGGYGVDDVPAHVRIDEGLLGQCAASRQTLVLTDVPPGFWRVASGLGEARPGTLMLLPLVSDKELLGVLEIASLDEGFAASRTMLEGVLPVLSMNLEILLAGRLSAHNSIAACRAEEGRVRERQQSAAGNIEEK